MKFKQLYLAIFLGAVFFFVGLLTLPDYGVNWDAINHLPRGQAYLHYFLTGKEDFTDLPKFKWYWQRPESFGSLATNNTRSFYQSDNTPFSYFINYDGNGHPPLSDILSAAFNIILFQKTNLINDIDAYRIYGIFCAALLISLVFWWGKRVYGFVAGLVGAVSLSVYPLFWAESHFNNEKDIPETVFWSFLLFSIWKGIADKSWKWMLVSGIFLGLALGTKFNVLFSILVILPWLFIVLIFSYLKAQPKIKVILEKNNKLLIAAIFSPVLGLAIFVGTWPYLWADPIKRIGGVITFYKTIGTTSNIDFRFLGPFGTNTYPIQWIIFTTPVVILFFSIIGITLAFLKFRTEKDKTSLLFLLWLAIPILRVSWPGTTVYGGIRQIMEYVPALALLTGLGSQGVYEWVLLKIKRLNFISLNVKKFVLIGIILVSFVPTTVKLIQIHPNENVYFNFLIGGLSGAKARNLPSWGNTFGAAYRQGILWLNTNAEKNAKIALARELLPNIPNIWIRPDLILHNSFRSGFLRNGEYVIGLTYEGTDETAYFDRYLEKFLIPVYEVEVDETAILKIWKNDENHTRKEYIKDQKLEDFSTSSSKQGLHFDFGKLVQLSRVEASFSQASCAPLKQGLIRISENGIDWKKLPGKMPREDWNVPAYEDQPKDNHFLIPFAADRARFLEIMISPDNACLKHLNQVSVYYF